MLMIRFQRIGRKNDASFRIAVLEKTSGPKAGKYVDLVGSYNPKTKVANVNGEKIKEWVAKGAQVSPTAMNLFIREGIYEGKKSPAVSKKNLEKNKAKNEEAAAAVVAAQEAAEQAAKDAAKAAKEAAEAPALETPVEESAAETEPEVQAAEEDPIEAEGVVEEAEAPEEAAVPAE
jgi:small subunit ribosomal protein S16